jgi:DNA-binding transcriptional LysR family regulator
MEFSQIEAFLTVARTQNFTRAAALLYLTQPAVTRQIAALEEELKTRLFDRLGRGTRLTAAGEVFLSYAERVVQLREEARVAVREIEAGTAGCLQVGASSTLATYVLPPLLKAFREAHPGVEIAIHTGVSARVRELVLAGSVEVGLVTTEGADTTEHDTRLHREPLQRFTTCVVVPPAHPLTEQPMPLDVSSLGKWPLVMMEPGTNLRAYSDHLLSEAGNPVHITMAFDNVEAIKRMIEAGLGISLLPEVAVQSEVEARKLVALSLAGESERGRQMALLSRKDAYQTTATKNFIDLLKIGLLTQNPTG